MTTHSVVEDLDVFPDCRYCLVARLEMAVMNELLFDPSSTVWEPLRREICEIPRKLGGGSDANRKCSATEMTI